MNVAWALVPVAMIAGCKFADPPVIVDGPPTDASELDAPADAPTCTATTCTGSALSVCGPGGVVASIETCRLGCATSERCAWIEPSNGLEAFFAAAASQPAHALSAGTTIDTDSGAVRGPTGDIVAVATDTLPQTGGQLIRVFLARSWSIAGVRVEGSLPVAFVAIGDIRVTGIVDVSAEGAVPGPGAHACGAPARGGHQTGGQWEFVSGSGWAWATDGAGGGGYASAGGPGGSYTDTAQPPGAGGVVNGSGTVVPLRGGCDGGGADQQGANSGHGGGGGGAAQLVSASGEVRIVGTAAGLAGLHAGGGGGVSSTPAAGQQNATASGAGGGGSGGALLIEAAAVTFDEFSMLVAAGGGGGGAGGTGTCGTGGNGADGPPSGSVASGGVCPRPTGGDWARGGDGAGTATAQPGGGTADLAAGSGGGGLGYLRINTPTATFAGEANAIVRGSLTTGTAQVE